MNSEGTTGWVLQSLLSGRRTALVSPWEIKADNPPPQVTVRSDDSESARAVAIVEAGVIANIGKCDGRWCQRLDRQIPRLPAAEAAVGNLSERDREVSGRETGLLALARTSRTTTSMWLMTMPSGGFGTPSTRIESPGMSMSSPCSSMKKWLWFDVLVSK